MSSRKLTLSDVSDVARETEEEKKRCSPGEGTPLLPSQPLQCSADDTMTRIYCTCSKLTNRVLLVDIFAILFGISAWISINGMYVQLPLMVDSQPEEWNLPSYLAVIIQVANIGPILYSVSQKLCPGKVKDSFLISIILICGTTASLLMSFFYNKTTFIAGSEHSTALFSLTFVSALVGCTSSVLFMPYMGNFREIYLISYFIGEGLSGFLPSVVALIQGVGGNPVCMPTNSSVTEPDYLSDTELDYSSPSSVMVPYYSPPRFSTDAFYFFLFGMMTISTIAFFLLNNLRICQRERIDLVSRSRSPSMKYEQTNKEESERNAAMSAHAAIFTVREDVETLMNDTQVLPKMHAGGGESPTHFCKHADLKDSNMNVTSTPPPPPDVKSDLLSQSTYIYFLVIAAWVCMFGNGIFPSIQSFSCLPYGNVAYHLSVTLGSMANPMACFIAFFYPYSSVRTISVLTLLSNILITYILTTAFLSPVPPLVDSAAGEALVVISWVIVTGLITYVKVSVASLFRRQGGRGLFWCGAVQQMGSAVGALLFFFLINEAELLVSHNPCSG